MSYQIRSFLQRKQWLGYLLLLPLWLHVWDGVRQEGRQAEGAALSLFCRKPQAVGQWTVRRPPSPCLRCVSRLDAWASWSVAAQTGGQHGRCHGDCKRKRGPPGYARRVDGHKLRAAWGVFRWGDRCEGWAHMHVAAALLAPPCPRDLFARPGLIEHKHGTVSAVLQFFQQSQRAARHHSSTRRPTCAHAACVMLHVH